jgi:uncharacterized protein (TIGR02265 family)
VFELARPTFERFKDSLLGRVIFTASSFEDNLRAASKAYRRTSETVRCDVAVLSSQRAVLAIRGCWDFPEWHVGIFHGAMQAFGKHGHLLIRHLELSSFDLELTW